MAEHAKPVYIGTYALTQSHAHPSMESNTVLVS